MDIQAPFPPSVKDNRLQILGLGMQYNVMQHKGPKADNIRKI